MRESGHFSLPFSGMKDGFHQYVFNADTLFFKSIEKSPISDGTFEILVEADKRPGITDLTFSINGHASAVCDRCLADINLPVSGTFSLLVKTGTEDAQHDEVIFVKEDQPSIDLTQVIYEFICLSLPLVNVYDCSKDVPLPCNTDVLKKIVGSGKNVNSDENKGILSDLLNFNTDN
jgi:hypothetical protein